MNDPIGLTVTKERLSFKISIKDALKAVGKGLTNVAFQNWDSAAKDGVELLSSVGLAKTLGQKSWFLIYSSLTKATISLIRQHKNLFREPLRNKDLEKYNDRFEEALSKKEVIIDNTFFKNPTGLTILKDIQSELRDWLMAIGLTEIQANDLAAQLPNKFFIELIKEWNNKPELYKSIKEHFNKNPFADAWTQEQARLEYVEKRANEYLEPVLGDPNGMTLGDIYIEPKFRVHIRCFEEDDPRVKKYRESNERIEPFIKVDYDASIHSYLEDFLFKKNLLNLSSHQAQILLLLGYPGQGKTSFCKRVIYDIAKQYQNNKPLFFIKLRNIKRVKDLTISPLETIAKYLGNTESLDVSLQSFYKSVTILDGLDELYMKEGLSNDDIVELCRELRRTCDMQEDLQIILTSRYGYIELEKLKKDKFLVLRLEAFSQEQQHQWLAKYKIFHPECKLSREKIAEINDPKNHNFQYIRELINQPILLQLIATSNYDIDQSSTRSSIYNQLFKALIDRKWAKDRQLENLSNMKKRDLERYLSEIALAIYQSDFEYIRKTDLEALPATKKFQEKLVSKDMSDTLKNIMMAFYFQEVEKDHEDRSEETSNYAIEFLHKSLQEYLVAVKVWTTFRIEFLAKKEEDEYVIDNWREALRIIFPLLSARALSPEVVDYLAELIDSVEIPIKNELKERLKRFLPNLIRRDFLLNYDAHQSLHPITQALNTFYGYWSVLSSLDLSENLIEESTKDGFCYLISIFNPYRYKPINLRNQNLHKAIFYRAFLREADFTNSNLSGAKLYRARLKFAKFNNANLDSAELQHSHLQGADLRNANLKNTNLKRAILLEANISQAKGITYEQLSRVLTLYKTIGIPNKIKARLKQNHPELFKEYFSSKDRFDVH